MEQYWQKVTSKVQPTVHISLYRQPDHVDTARKPRKYYRPVAHRSISILFLLAIALVFTGLIEHSLRKLPHHNTSSRRPTRFQKRQLTYSSGDGDIDATIYALTHDVDEDTLNAATDGLQEDDPSTDDESLLDGNEESEDMPRTSTAFDVGPESHLNPSVGTFGYEDFPSDLARSTADEAPAKETPLVEPGSTPEPVEGPTTLPSSTRPSPSAAPTSIPQETATPVRVSPEIATFDTQQSLIPDASTAVLTVPQSTTIVSYDQSLAKTYVQPGATSAAFVVATPGEPPLSAYLDSNVHTTTTSKSTSRTKVSGSPTSRPEAAALFLKSDVPLSFVKDPVNYFYGIYLPVLLAVFFRMLIGYLYTTTKMMEPFMMLSRTEGVSAKDLLWINYLSANDTLAPFQAMFSGHWLMLWTAILYGAVQTLSPLGAELFGIYPSLHKISDKAAVHGAAVWVHPQIARLMQGLLAFACVMLISFWLLLRKTKSHIYSDPSTIASIASLVHHPNTVQDFEELDQTLLKRKTVQRLSHKTYQLGFYQAYDGSERYGIISSHEFSLEPNSNVHDDTSDSKSSTDGNKILIQLSLNALLFVLTAGLLSLIAIYYANRNPNNKLELFMSSQRFGPRFLLIIVGIIIKSQWTRLERRSVVFDPFHRFQHESHGHGASAKSTVLATRSLIPITTLASSVFRRSFLPALLAFTALLSECLIIVLPGIPFDAGQLWRASRISRYLCFSILGFMILVMWGYWGLKAWQWAKKEDVRLPKDPNTLGAMMMYVAGTRMADELGELGACTGREMKKLDGWDRRVGLMKKGERWVVDFEDGVGWT